MNKLFETILSVCKVGDAYDICSGVIDDSQKLETMGDSKSRNDETLQLRDDKCEENSEKIRVSNGI